MAKALGWVALGVVGLLLVLAVIGSQIPQKPYTERVKENCDKQFGPGTEQSQQCQLAILATTLQQQQGDKLRQAQRDSE